MYSIGEAARLTGINIETIRYYEREGIVPMPLRTDSGRRQYDDQKIVTLRFVKRCRELDFPIADIRALLMLSQGHNPVCLQVKKISETHLGSVRAKIKDLRQLEVALKELIKRCENDVAECPALRRLFDD